MAQSLGKITQCHKQSLSKLKKANYIKHLFQPQCYETGDQLQLKKKKTAKHITHGGKQYATKQQMDQRRN